VSTIESVGRELAFRAQNGIEVTLLWWAEDDRLAVSVVDQASGGAFVVPVGAERPLDVFQHPYAYAARQAVA
jgi:hypothetical protein